MKKAPLLLLAALAGGCTDLYSIKYRSYPNNPFPDITRVAVFPFKNATQTPLDGAEFATIFSSELVKFPGFEAIRPAMLAELQPQTPVVSAVMDVKRLSARLKADAVVLVTINEYDPYHPPKISLTLRMFRLRFKDMPTRDIDRLTRSAEWRSSNLPNEMAPYVVAMLERTFDTREDWLRREIEGYGKAQKSEDEPWRTPGDAALHVQERFFQFVSNYLIREIIAREHQARQGATQ